DLDEATQKQLTRGERMVEILKQKQYVPMSLAKQVLIIWAGVNGYLDSLPVSQVAAFEEGFFEFCSKNFPDLEHVIAKEKDLSPETVNKLRQAVEQFKVQFTSK
ncbi:MAG: F0F1 ATP synthase subunit alpha, partial [Candidatus Zixiibacteriota bacterium]